MEGQSPAGEQWEQLPAAGQHISARSGIGEVLFNGRIYVFGGYDQTAFQDLCAYDIKTRTWSQVEQTGEIPSARTSHSLVLDEENALIYCIFGSGSVFGHSNLNDFYVFDILLRKWSRLRFTGDAISGR